LHPIPSFHTRHPSFRCPNVPYTRLPHAHRLRTTPTSCTIQVLKSSTFHSKHTLSHHLSIVFGCMNRSFRLAPHSLFPHPYFECPNVPSASWWVATCAPFAHHPKLYCIIQLLKSSTFRVKCRTPPPTLYCVWVLEQMFLSCTPFPLSKPDTPRLGARTGLLPGSHVRTICAPPQPIAQSKSSSLAHAILNTPSATIFPLCSGA